MITATATARRVAREPSGRMLRYTSFLATEKHDAMVHEGREDEFDALVAEAPAQHDEYADALPTEPDRRSRELAAALRLDVI